MKYVIAMINGCESPILFPEHVGHDSFANLPIVSAGFVCIEADNEVSVYGKSFSLKKANNGVEDERLIRKLLKL